ncbi:MAG: ATP-binding protein [Rhodothermales bacterium]|nr:ATP-binding protein [Rhodothermales bacterium]
MDAQTHHFRNLDTVIDQVHGLFDAWEELLPPRIDVNLLYQLKLAVHEWLANLVQHANFETEAPDVSLTVEPDGDRLRCVIEDNSDGFVLDAHLEIEPEYLDSLPERGMGLLILKICTEKLEYQRSEYGGFNRLAFYVSAEQEAWPDILS